MLPDPACDIVCVEPSRFWQRKPEPSGMPDVQLAVTVCFFVVRDGFLWAVLILLRCLWCARWSTVMMLCFCCVMVCCYVFCCGMCVNAIGRRHWKSQPQVEMTSNIRDELLVQCCRLGETSRLNKFICCYHWQVRKTMMHRALRAVHR